MSDSSNDESKDFNNSEVSSTCNVGRRNQSAEAGEGASTSDAPIPRSLSPDTSEAANPGAVSLGDDLTSTTNEPRQEDDKSISSEDADVSGNVTGSNERSWPEEEPPASSSRVQPEDPAVSESTSKPWQMLVSYDSTSEEEDDDRVPQPAPVSESAETREISTTQTPRAGVSPSNGQNVSGSADVVRDEGASSSEMRLEGSSVSGSHDFNLEGEAGSSSNVEDITEGQEEAQLTSSGNNNNDGVESSRPVNQPELEAEEEEEEEEVLTSSGHDVEIDADIDEPEPTATVSGSDDLHRESRAVHMSSSNNIIASLLTAERPASSEADPLGQPQGLAVRPDSPSTGRARSDLQVGVSRSLEIPLAQPSPSGASILRLEEAAVAARRLVSSATPRANAGMSVLAQQLRVSSAGQGHSSLMRELISSRNELGVSNRCGPDSTTVDQSAAAAASGAEEVSTTEDDHPGQVSTSQQRGSVSTSWPAASGVSSSADSPISTSNMLGGLLASRLSRDPQVSTSVSTGPRPRDSSDPRDGSGASSTTSGLRGLLSTPARTSSNFARANFSPPTQSISPTLAEPTDNAMSGHQPEVASGFVLSPQPSPSSSQRPTEQSFLAMQLAGPSLATAPGDKFPGGDDKGKKRKASSPDRDRPRPPPPGPSAGSSRSAGPSRERQNASPPSASLMEQLRKAGVIITPVPTPADAPQPPQPREPEVEDQNGDDSLIIVEEQDQQTSRPSSSIPRDPIALDLSVTEEENDEIKQEDDEGQIVLVDEEVMTPEKKRPGRKKGKRKPVELNPEMLRPKRPRRAKEKPEEEEKPKVTPKKVEPPPPTPEGETPKKRRGRKPKALLLQLAAEAKAREEAEALAKEQMEETPAATETAEESQGQENETPDGKPEKRQWRKGGKRVPKTPKQRTPKPKPVREPQPQDEETRMSATAEDSQQGKTDNTPRKRFVLPILQPLEVSAEEVAEYQWPANDRLADMYMLQEQIALYLGVKSFKRKYPDLKRRPVEPQEREYLQEKGIVSETMCDLGLTAVLSAEVLDIMSADYHEKYEEYKRALREKHAKEMLNKQKTTSTFKPMDAKTRAMQSAAKWNASFNKERKEERRCCCDLQTMTFHFPEQKRSTVMNKAKPSPGTYPVALIPGQFTDFYKPYTPTELKYMPLNTVMYGPLRPNEQLEEQMSEGSQSDSEGSSSSDDSSSDSSSEGSADSADTESTAPEAENDNFANAPPPGSKCKTCSLPGMPENMVTCAQCSTSGHLLCLGLNTDMLSHIRQYSWQCTDCKTCIQCKDPADEDKMLFCDLCDRGYHIYCVGLRKVPEGRWHCKVCSVCGSCGSIDPSGTDTPQPVPPNSPDKGVQWQHEYKKGEKNSKVYAQTLCVPCSRLWRKGSYCQHCARCFRTTDRTTMVNCSICDKWLHAECCNLAPGPELAKLNFVCDNCQEGSQVRATPRLIKVAAKVH